MKVFLVGIKGVAMSALAVILFKMGYEVNGSDVKESFITDEELKKCGIIPKVGFDPNDITSNLNLIIYSGANKGKNNPQVIKALSLGIKTFTQTEYICQIMKDFDHSIAVTGSHGKTTTSSLLSYCLIQLGEKPSYMIGSSSFNNYSGGDFNGKKYFVFEADEYAVDPPYDNTIKLELYKPDSAIITNIDFDHPDVYRDIEHVKQVFLRFIDNTGRIHICIDDANSQEVLKKIDKSKIKTFGFSKEADLQITSFKIDYSGSKFNLLHKGIDLEWFETKLYGEKNISNITGVVSLLLDLGFELRRIKDVIKDFKGAKRRFELIFKQGNTYLFDDYAHHPAEIEATIKAARSVFKNKRLVVIFQSHTYSRTQKFLKEFTQTLSLADLIYIMPIFSSARENEKEFNVTSQSIVDTARQNIQMKSLSNKDELLAELKKNLKSGDVIFTMGAGYLNNYSTDIIEVIKNLN